MILRRLTKHVKDQNWFAVGLDFLIVVVGVFIGIQVANWNTARTQVHEYNLALERFASESRANLETLNSLDAELSNALADVRTAFDAFRSCEESPENRTKIGRSLDHISGTSGLYYA